MTGPCFVTRVALDAFFALFESFSFFCSSLALTIHRPLVHPLARRSGAFHMRVRHSMLS